MATKSPRRKFGALQKERVFFACVPDEATAARIHALAEELKRAHGFTGTLIQPQHLHVTLFHLGDWPQFPKEIVEIAKQAASTLRAPNFDAAFPRAESFRTSTGAHPFVLTCGKGASVFRPLHSALGDALRHAGLGGATKGDFKPHITLLRDRLYVPPAAIEPIHWTVRDVVLIHSLLGRTTHVHLGRWPLADGPKQISLF